MTWQESPWAASAWQQNPGIRKRRWALYEEEELELGLEDELEYELSSVEITKELCLYFAETEKEDRDREGRATVTAATGRWWPGWMWMLTIGLSYNLQQSVDHPEKPRER